MARTLVNRNITIIRALKLKMHLIVQTSVEEWTTNRITLLTIQISISNNTKTVIIEKKETRIFKYYHLNFKNKKFTFYV